MKFNPNVHHRHSTRLREWDYSWPWWYYVTICAYERRCIFGEVINDKMRLNDIGEIVREEWMKTPTIRPEIELDGFVVMPNHVHGIIIINDTVGATGPVARRGNYNKQERATRRVAPTKRLVSGSLGAIIGQFKSKAAKRINAMRGAPDETVWQRGYHDHIVRNEADLHRIRTYIEYNPLQWSIDEENPKDKKSMPTC